MDAEAKAVMEWLQGIFKGSEIEYRDDMNLHTFRISRGQATYWLYASYELLEDETTEDIIRLAEKEKVITRFKSSKKRCWIYIGTDGAQEVDETFPKKTRQ